MGTYTIEIDDDGWWGDLLESGGDAMVRLKLLPIPTSKEYANGILNKWFNALTQAIEAIDRSVENRRENDDRIVR